MSYTFDITGDTCQKGGGKWFAFIQWVDPSGEQRLFASEDVDTEEEAQVLVIQGVQSVVRRLQTMDANAVVEFEMLNGVKIGNA